MFLPAHTRFGAIICALGLVATNTYANGQTTPIPIMHPETQNAAAPITYDDAVVPCAGTCPSCDCAPKKCCCTEKKKAELAAAVKAAHKPLYYLNDFSYINDSCYCDWWPGDRLKQLKVGDCTTVDFGGQYRMRFHGEENIRNFGPGGGLGLTGADDEFVLHRLRLYSDVKAGEHVRFFGEMLHAESNFEDLAPRPIEENYWDIQNLFIDVKAGGLTGRVGRQEIALGAERLVSPLDWANTRRTFDGGRLMFKNDDWNIDGFWLRPTIRDLNSVDESNNDQQLYGLYSTYKGFGQDILDAYWIAFENDAVAMPFNFQTIGGRYLGNVGCHAQVEVEGGYQFGDNPDSSSHDAGFFTAGVGRSFDHAWKPTIWFYYDWASGGDAQADGTGFHHLQPLAHKYLGFMDLFGRRNIESPNVRVTFSPRKRWKCLVWYYYLFLQDSTDTPYTVVMTPFQPGVTPISADLGHEIDFTAAYTINERMNFLLGYSHFAPGSYYDSPGLAFNDSANFFYAQYLFNF